jgi:hypothetical protein
MNAESNQTPIDVLDRATAALRDAAPTESPPPSLVASTVGALQSRNAQRTEVAQPTETASRYRLLRYGSLAAAVAVAILVAFSLLIDRTARLTFAQVVENVRNAKSVQFVVTTKWHDKMKVHAYDNAPGELETKMAIQGDMVRYEVAGATIIVNMTDRKGIELHTIDQVAEKRDFSDKKAAPPEVLQNLVERLRHLKDEIKGNFEQLADEDVAGRKCQVFQVKSRPKDAASWLVPSEFKLWVDAATGLPVRIQAENENQSVIYDHFVWDQPLDEKLFNLDVPLGYRLRELTPAVVVGDRIYVGRRDMQIESLRPDGHDAQRQFVPRFAKLPDVYVPDKTEISPDGRYLAMAFTNTTEHGSFPPDRIYLWDRTRATETADVIYARPGAELNSWQFSADGRQLYVQWWQPLHEQTRPEGRLGAEVVDLKDKTKHELKLPTFKDAVGKEQTMRFMAASSDGHTYLVVGGGMQVADDQGQIERRLTSATSDPIVGGSVRLSPDDKQVLYVVSHPQDQSEELFVVPVAGGEPKSLIAAGKFNDLRARWSPDGKRIAYTCRSLDPKNPPFNYGAEASLVTVDPDGNQAVTVLNEKVDRTWGPTLELIGWR